VGRVESAAARVEANFSAKMAAKSGFKRRGIKLRGMGRRWGDVLRHRVQNIFEDTGVGCKPVAEVRSQNTEVEARVAVMLLGSSRLFADKNVRATRSHPLVMHVTARWAGGEHHQAVRCLHPKKPGDFDEH